MRIKVIRDEADRLVLEHGAGAAEFVLAKLKSARHRKNMRLERFLNQVASELERRSLKTVATSEAERSAGAPFPN